MSEHGIEWTLWVTGAEMIQRMGVGINSGPKAVQSTTEFVVMIDLFDRWERVWHEGPYDLIPSCVGSHYIRHDEQGDQTVTREAYAAELAAIRQERPDIRVVVYNHSFTDDRAWFRFAFKWSGPKTGEPRSRAGMQSYRIEGGQLAETWIRSSRWHRIDRSGGTRTLDKSGAHQMMTMSNPPINRRSN